MGQSESRLKLFVFSLLRAANNIFPDIFQLFFAIYNYYESLPSTLVSSSMLEIVNAIVHTLGESKMLM